MLTTVKQQGYITLPVDVECHPTPAIRATTKGQNRNHQCEVRQHLADPASLPSKFHPTLASEAEGRWVRRGESGKPRQSFLPYINARI